MNKKYLYFLVIGLFVFAGTVGAYLYFSKDTNVELEKEYQKEVQVEEQNSFPKSDSTEQKEVTTANEVVVLDKNTENDTATTAQEVQDIAPQTEETTSFVSRVIDFILPDKTDGAGDPLKVNQNVPFTSQAPNAEWEDDRYQDGCEEASVLMALYWAQGKSLSREIATKEIANMSAWELKTWGVYNDSSTVDTKRLLTEYYNYKNVELFYDITVDDIKRALIDGGVVIIPADGQKLNNPYFTPPGPPIHMLVIRGFDENKKEFITNDPGTRRGAEFRYKYSVIMDALRDYPTGPHEENPIIKVVRTAMLVVKK